MSDAVPQSEGQARNHYINERIVVDDVGLSWPPSGPGGGPSLRSSATDSDHILLDETTAHTHHINGKSWTRRNATRMNATADERREDVEHKQEKGLIALSG